MVGGQSGIIHIWDLKTDHNEQLVIGLFDKMLVTTSGDCSAKVWRTKDWTLMRELRHDAQRWVWDAAFTLDSRYLFTGSSDSYARLWNLEKGTLEREYCGHQKPITALAFRDQAV
ncbi:unnamed protein product [Leptidea sinapis]|uniref:Target of rapamycin complex subunit lst8 n=1 Tax=Leptidea sinapis TaxID=189913 RepID=A0A5E4QGW2_9NEOP|nr:unnamed protein product [Leptidea sinapis]